MLWIGRLSPSKRLIVCLAKVRKTLSVIFRAIVSNNGSEVECDMALSLLTSEIALGLLHN